MNQLIRISNKIAGAWGESAILPGKFSSDKLKKEYAKMVEKDRIETGTDPYSGSWKSMPELKILSGIKINRIEAEEYCLKKAEKWEYACAVRFYVDDKIPKLKEKTEGFEIKFSEVLERLAKKYKVPRFKQMTKEQRLKLLNEKDQKLYLNSFERWFKARSQLFKLEQKAKTNWMIAGWAAT